MKKKLLFINGHMNTGGVEKALLDILTHLDYEKYEVDLLLTEKYGDYFDQLPSQVNVLLRSIEQTYGSFPQVMMQCLKKKDWFSFKMRLILQVMKLFGQRWIKNAKKMLTDEKHYDCVIGFRPGFCTQIAAFAVDADRRITWWHHGEVNVDLLAYQEVAEYCDQIVVVSDSCRQMLMDTFPLLTSKMVTVNNILDVQTVQQKGTCFDPYHSKELLQIVSVGRLASEKHFENAIYVAKWLKDGGIRFRWHLVGDGELREWLEQQTIEKDVVDCFVFEGNQINPYPYIKNADLFVHSSYVESFGIVVAEALALGVPCVVTKSTGVMSFLVDGENAILTEQSQQSLAEKVSEVLNSNELREHLKKNARCPEEFLPRVVIRNIDEVIGVSI